MLSHAIISAYMDFDQPLLAWRVIKIAYIRVHTNPRVTSKMPVVCKRSNKKWHFQIVTFLFD